MTASALLGEDEDGDALARIEDALEGPTAADAAQRRGQIAAVSLALGGD